MVPGKLNIGDILTNRVIPAAIGMELGFLFQQDNARTHIFSATTRNCMESIRIPVMNWSALI